MFERMVLSGAGRRDRRLSKFFVGSSLAYLLLAGSALAVSICVSDPKLAGSGGNNTRIFVDLFQQSGGAHPPAVSSRPAAAPRPNLYSTRPLEYITRPERGQLPPVVAPILDSLDGAWPLGGVGRGNGNGDQLAIGVGDRPSAGDPPPVPPGPKRASQPVEVQHPRENHPMRVSPPVLQGKAIYRKTPEYPALAKIIKREGSVVVEVVISPEGLVESARAVSGDPLLARTAVAAALEWKFQPTYLGNVPVRVAGAITFVFKLAD